jgi:hypothetical protein
MNHPYKTLLRELIVDPVLRLLPSRRHHLDTPERRVTEPPAAASVYAPYSKNPPQPGPPYEPYKGM